MSEKENVPTEFQVEASGLDRMLLAQVIFRGDFPVSGGKELGQFVRIKTALDLEEMETLLANTDALAKLETSKMNEKKSYTLSRDLVLYVRDVVFERSNFSGMGANAIMPFIKHVYSLVGAPEEKPVQSAQR